MPNASRESAASDRPRTTNSRKCDRSRTLTAGILQIAVDAKAVRRCALTIPGMTAIEHLHDNPPFPVIERATTLVRKGHQPGRLNSYLFFPTLNESYFVNQLSNSSGISV